MCGQRRNLISARCKESVSINQKRAGMLLNEFAESGFNFAVSGSSKRKDLQT